MCVTDMTDVIFNTFYLQSNIRIGLKDAMLSTVLSYRVSEYSRNTLTQDENEP